MFAVECETEGLGNWREELLRSKEEDEKPARR